MTSHRLAAVFVAAAFIVAGGSHPGAGAPQERKAVPREGSEQRKPPDTSEPRRAVPRPPAAESKPPAEARRGDSDAGRREAQPRREPPRRSEVPQRYHALPRAYFFPPVDVRLGFYYHPYFGFYYGPYYGPYYPYPGPPVRAARYSAAALRLKVRPPATEVYVNGYYAGIVDDFDGVFQRLYLPAGEHQLVLRMAGYETHVLPLRLSPGGTLDVTHQMRPLVAGGRALPPPQPRALPREWTDPPEDADGESPASPYGIFALRTEPADARIFVDGEAWAAVEGQDEFVIHLPAGWHQIEARRDGYQPFSTRVELSQGQLTRLHVRLVRQ